MKNILLALFLVISNSWGSAAQSSSSSDGNDKKTITLPSAEILQQRLEARGLCLFLKTTKLVAQLGGAVKGPLEVVVAVNRALSDCNEQLQLPMVAMALRERRPEIISCILQDHPDALDFLKKQEFLK